MALALFPTHHSSRNLHSPLPSPAILLASAAMEQVNKNRPSLPSISSLIEAVTERAEKRKAPSPVFDPVRRLSSGGSQGNVTSPVRPNISGSPRRPPPTPELPPTSSFDFPRPSPSNISPITAPGRNNYYPPVSSAPNLGLYTQRPSPYPTITEPPSTYPPISDLNQWSSSQPPRAVPDASQQDQLPRPPPTPYGDAPAEPSVYNGLAHQRPLPTNFPPPIPGPPSLPPMDTQMGPTWQHHHYYPPANPAAYPQTQERYICPTCNKPFSRPSSLKIHTYSHTGEKPYKCKHEGCGKYFSVRSNMKRHEKGCHGGESSSTSSRKDS